MSQELGNYINGLKKKKWRDRTLFLHQTITLNPLYLGHIRSLNWWQVTFCYDCIFIYVFKGRSIRYLCCIPFSLCLSYKSIFVPSFYINILFPEIAKTKCYFRKSHKGHPITRNHPMPVALMPWILLNFFIMKYIRKNL